MTSLELENPAERLLSIQKVIVAVDLTEHSRATAHYAAQVAEWLGATLYVVHVFTPESWSEFGSDGAYSLVEQHRRDYSTQLNELASDLRKLIPKCESVFLMGDPAEKISGLAIDLDVDLIVTASHHPKFLGRLFNLDKAPQILHRAPCSVLVYHENDH